MKIKFVKEQLNESIDYSEVEWKMDKFLPDDSEIQNEFYEILNDQVIMYDEKEDILIEFFETYANKDRMFSYFPKNGSIKEFVKYLIDKS